MSVVRQWDPLVGRRAVYTRIEREYEARTNSMREVKREQFRGVVVALVTTGEHHYPAVVMLWDDGSMSSHGIEHITVEGESAGYRDGFAGVDAPEHFSPKAAGPLPYHPPAPIPMPTPGPGRPQR